MKLRYLGIILLLGVFAGGPAVAAAPGPEAVTALAQTADLSPAGELTLTDEIDYDFGAAAPHEITFSIPLSYHDDQGREFRVGFTMHEASLGGQPISLKPVVTLASARFALPPGPATAASTRHYTLHYALAPVVLRGTEADIFKLSVTGLGWAAPINRVTMRLETPTAPADNVTCFTGAQGSTTGACTVDQQGKVANVVSYAPLAPGESLSIFSDFPHGSFTRYLEPYEEHPATPARLLAPVLAGLVLVVAGIIAFIWRRRHQTEPDL